MNFIRRLEQKFGKYAIRELPAIIIGLYAAGYLLSVIAPNILGYLTLDPVYILKGQVWRLVTWIIVPPGGLDIFTIIMLFFYFSIARALVMKWGDFRFNLYFFTGMLFTVIGAFLVYVFWMLRYGFPISLGASFSTYYINMSIFLAFALSYPEATVLLYFIIPVKMKWMGVLYGVLIAWSFFQSGIAGKVLILASLLNFLIFWLLTRNENKGSYGRRRPSAGSAFGGFRSFGSGISGSSGKSRGSGRSGGGASARINPQSRKQGGRMEGGADRGNAPLHRCTICGRTELDSDTLEFRYCSKCDGAYEYCQDHLFTHNHIHNS